MANSLISKKLKEARKAAGLTQKEVYEKINVPQSTFSSWEIGKSEPDADTFIKLCFIYGIESFSHFNELHVNSQNERYVPTINEYDHIKKYRTLDEYGKKYVDSILDNEYERCQQQYADVYVAARGCSNVPVIITEEKADKFIKDSEAVREQTLQRMRESDL